MILYSSIDHSVDHSASILCIGMGWFPQTPGGLNRYVYDLTSHLAERDEVELCGAGLPHTYSNTLLKLTNLAEANNSLPQRLWSVWKNFPCSRRQINKPDAINLHFALYSLPLLSSLPPDVPITFTFHGPWALESEREGFNRYNVRAKQWVEQQVYQRCDRFIVLSKAFGNILQEHFQISRDKIHVIPGGVDTHRFQRTSTRHQAREKLKWPQDRFILFTPRRLASRMGLDVLLNALAKVVPDHPEVWLAIVGEGVLRSPLEQQIEALGLSQNVKLLGYLPDEDLPLAYQASDLTVVPSQALEGFGLVLLESLACETPVLCTPIGGMPEILTQFSPELICDSIDAEAVAAKLDAVLTGKVSLPSQRACRDYTTTYYDWSIITPQVRAVLLGAKSPVPLQK